MQMTWFERYAAKRPPDFVVTGGNEAEPYMQRWWLIPRNNIFNVYLHYFLHSDDDRALHDHPSWNISIILRGEYTEWTIAEGGVHHATVFRKGNWTFRFAKKAHRIELHNGPCWTLFINGPKLRTWGFHCPKGWRPWQDFVNDRDHGKIGRGCD